MDFLIEEENKKKGGSNAEDRDDVPALSTTPSLGLRRPCHALADILLAQWVVVRWYVLFSGLDHVVEVFDVGCDAA